MIAEAAKLLEVEESVLEGFDVVDPYNGNTISGFLCKQADYRYGALVICVVNSKKVPLQRILCTPKLGYPFGKNRITGERIYHWPDFNRARIYEKWDGTNILAYSYQDADEHRYVTFKTRLTPVLRASAFGDFKSMWDEMLVKYPALRCPDVVLCGIYSLSFELCGYRNPILVHYDFPLDTILIFGVAQNHGFIVPPEELEGLFKKSNVRINKRLHDLGSGEDATDLYNKMRKEANEKNKKSEDGLIIGQEGFVFYTLFDKIWSMYKCKPEDIESIHWTSDSIQFNSVLVTTWNALENVEAEELTVEFISELLKEEFSDTQIAKSVVRIHKAVEVVQSTVAFRKKVKEIYDARPEDAVDKRAVMRYMSQHFEKKKMRVVFTALRAMGVVE